jgi:hypothetical protein
VTDSQSLLTILANLAEKNFQGIVTGDESWFAYLIESDVMVASSSAEVNPRIQRAISCKKVLITLFTATGRLILDVPPKGSKYNQDYFIDNILPALNQVRIENGHHKVTTTLIVHIDDSICHHMAKGTEKMSSKRLERACHLAYSPDISPCDFSAFGIIKGMIKDGHL